MACILGKTTFVMNLSLLIFIGCLSNVWCSVKEQSKVPLIPHGIWGCSSDGKEVGTAFHRMMKVES
jgi:hypothetical protein